MSEPKNPCDMPRRELVEIVRGVQQILFDTGEGWDADKEWDIDTLELIGQVFGDYGLRPGGS